MSNKSILLGVFGSTPQLRLVDFFLDNPRFDFTRGEIVAALGMAKRTLARHLPELLDSGVVEVSRKMGRAELYRLNSDSDVVVGLRKLEDSLASRVDVVAEPPQAIVVD